MTIAKPTHPHCYEINRSKPEWDRRKTDKSANYNESEIEEGIAAAE
jgi:hypothetical protein